jgi:hypothetical protein
MLITFDTEFLDDGATIELLSIGMVAADGDMLYRIVEDADFGRVQTTSPWVWKNVVLAHMPIKVVGADGPDGWGGWEWLDRHPDRSFVVPRTQVAIDVERFLFAHGGPDGVELWADYPATDHVALYQLFGPMVDCTEHGMPMRTSCLTQEEESVKRHIRRHLGATPGSPESVRALAVSAIGDFTYRKPEQPEAEKHNALWDAEHDMALARWLELT